jgi:hypothetical protein
MKYRLGRGCPRTATPLVAAFCIDADRPAFEIIRIMFRPAEVVHGGSPHDPALT